MGQWAHTDTDRQTDIYSHNHCKWPALPALPGKTDFDAVRLCVYYKWVSESAGKKVANRVFAQLKQWVRKGREKRKNKKDKNECS